MRPKLGPTFQIKVKNSSHMKFLLTHKRLHSQLPTTHPHAPKACFNVKPKLVFPQSRNRMAKASQIVDGGHRKSKQSLLLTASFLQNDANYSLGP